MPYVDPRSGEVAIRIVYDGAPEAGKTTNIARLLGQISLQRRGASKSPGTTGERTEFFDWLDFSGGFVDGRRVRCQLVSVPGQSRVLHRRRYLLERADAIVFVVDARPDAVDRARASVQTTLRIAGAVAGDAPLGIVLQANKQDLPGALSPDALRSALSLPGLTPAVAATAAESVGVMETFVLAVRLATDRVRLLLQRGELGELPAHESDADRLHATMAALEPPEPITLSAPSEPPPPPVPVTPEEPAMPVEITPVERTSSRPNRFSNLSALALPDAADFASGHVWPPVKGRAAFGAAATPRFSPSVKPWAPSGAFELATSSGTLHSTPHWTFANEGEARMELLTVVRRLVAEADFVPDQRALAIAPEAGRWRLWMLTPSVPTVDEELVEVVRDGSAARLDALVERFTAGVRRAHGAGAARWLDAVGIEGLGLQGDRLVRLTLGDPAEDPPPALLPLGASLVARLRGLVSGPLADWFAFEGAPRLARLEDGRER